MAISTIGTDGLASSAVTTTKLASGVPSRSQLPAGTVLQVVSGLYSSQISTSSASAVWTGLRATITPTSTTSKILVIANLSSVYLASAGNQASIYLYKDSALLNSCGQLYASNSTVETNENIVYLDSPATNTATTYDVYIAATIGTVYAHLNNFTSFITLMEIAA